LSGYVTFQLIINTPTKYGILITKRKPTNKYYSQHGYENVGNFVQHSHNLQHCIWLKYQYFSKTIL